MSVPKGKTGEGLFERSFGWLEDKVIRSRKAAHEELCLEEVCITKTELLELLSERDRRFVLPCSYVLLVGETTTRASAKNNAGLFMLALRAPFSGIEPEALSSLSVLETGGVTRDAAGIQNQSVVKPHIEGA